MFTGFCKSCATIKEEENELKLYCENTTNYLAMSFRIPGGFRVIPKNKVTVRSSVNGELPPKRIG
jgi:hypothetical protein